MIAHAGTGRCARQLDSGADSILDIDPTVEDVE
jgi:hypothetical protein